jgi:hypothetical protein
MAIVFTLKSWKMTYSLFWCYMFDDMLVANKSIVEINRLKVQWTRTFDMKDL